jgi:glycosyltransferase involved in cell wall biosynthesis
VLSFMDTMNLTALLACLGMRVGIVVSERLQPDRKRNGRGIDVARRLLYPRADRTVVQTTRVAAYFPRAMQRRISIIGNPIDPAAASAQPGIPGPRGRFRIVSLGRLEYQKGFDLLIDAFARIADENEHWDLVIFGDGQERESLARQAIVQGVAARVYFAGVTREPQRELAASHIMAFPSRFEGFPNALGEALAVGLPTVGCVGVSGVEDLIVDGVTGFLVSPVGGSAAFAAALERLVHDGDLRERMGGAARMHVRRWASEAILPEWEHLLEAIASHTIRRRRGALGEPEMETDLPQPGA